VQRFCRLGFLPSRSNVLAIVLGIFGCLPDGAQTNVYTVPQELQSAPGNGSAAFFLDNPHVQQVYAASEFSGLPVDAVMITGIAFRPDELIAGGSLSATIPGLELRLGILRGSIDSIPSTGFADTDNSIVFRGQGINLRGQSDLSFPLTIPFQAPFVYDRRAGQLVLDIFQTEGSLRSGAFDAERVDHGRGLFIFSGVTATHGDVIFATQFSFTAVPEPRPVPLAALSIAVLTLSGFLSKTSQSTARIRIPGFFKIGRLA
jgi:hypothetical protein